MIDPNASIFLAGHNGLVGRATHRALVRAGHKNIITRTRAELDLRDQVGVHEFFSEAKPEIVILAAAKVGGIMANMTAQADFLHDNLAIALNVIGAAHRTKVRKLINLSSSCVFPKNAPQPMREEMLLTGLPEPTNEGYAIAKIAAVKMCRYFSEQYGDNFFSLAPCNLYGPFDNFDFTHSHVLSALIRKFHLAKLLQAGEWHLLRNDLERYPESATRSGKQQITEYLATRGVTPESVDIWGTGTPLREFLHVDDLARAILFAAEELDATSTGEFLNAGFGEEISIRGLAELVRSTVGYEGEIRFDHAKPDGMMRKLLDSGRLNSLGWHPEISLPEGIRATYEWYSGE